MKYRNATDGDGGESVAQIIGQGGEHTDCPRWRWERSVVLILIHPAIPTCMWLSNLFVHDDSESYFIHFSRTGKHDVGWRRRHGLKYKNRVCHCSTIVVTMDTSSVERKNGRIVAVMRGGRWWRRYRQHPINNSGQWNDVLKVWHWKKLSRARYKILSMWLDDRNENGWGGEGSNVELKRC